MSAITSVPPLTDFAHSRLFTAVTFPPLPMFREVRAGVIVTSDLPEIANRH